jgi:serine/threonine-protein kinase
MEIVVQHIGEDPVPPSLRTELPITSDLEEAILWALHKDPGDRPASAQQWDTTLDSCSDNGKWHQPEAREWWEMHVPQGK